MIDVLLEILWFFGVIYEADKRPEARRFTIGCGLVVMVACLVFALWVALQR
jgi:hypothetical protein